jgi:hypothetical protein
MYRLKQQAASSWLAHAFRKILEPSWTWPRRVPLLLSPFTPVLRSWCSEP